MKRTAIVIALGLALVVVLNAAPAHAALRTFVASSGDDANTAANCTRSAPCRTLAQAFTVTAANGHIIIVDAAGYGALTITRSVTIVGTDGALIGVPSGGVGIIINAGANDTVNLHGLIIDGAGVGQDGIVFNTGKALTIANSNVRNMVGNGILFQPNASSALAVSNTVVTSNSVAGIRVAPTGSGTVTASLSRVELYNNTFEGFVVTGTASTGTITAVAADSVAAKNGDAGFAANSTSAPTGLMVVRSVSASNGPGLLAVGAAATLRVSQSTLTGNTVSWTITSSGVLRSYADNNIDGNGDAPEPAPTAIGKK